MKAGARRLAAVIDVGASAIRMDIAELAQDGRVRVLDSLYRAVALGADTFGSGRIGPGTAAACVRILRDFREKAEEYAGGPNFPIRLRAVGTSALREAENREEFIDRVFIATGIALEPIEEPEVHRLTFMALHALLEGDSPLRRGDVLVAEVGGGGTKLLLVQDGYVTGAETYRLGSLRVREVLEADEETDLGAGEALSRQIGRMLAQVRQTISVKKVSRLVAVVGDLPATLFRALKPDRTAGVPRPADCTMDVAEFEKVRRVAALPVSKLMKQYALSSQEAASVGPALAAYLSLARHFKVRTVTLARVDLRSGLLADESTRDAWSPHFTEQVIRSAMALGAKYAFDRAHALHVADLAVRFYREMESEFRPQVRHEVLLRAAAILHDIGAFVSSRSHHKHSAYLVGASELFGLTSRETALIALVTRYHRRATPSATHPEFTALDRASRALVLQLAAILRVADALDRSHAQRIRVAGFLKTGETLAVGVEDVGDLSLERAALEAKGDLFETVFGLRVSLRPTVMPGVR